MIRSIIIEDSKLARIELLNQLATQKNIDVIGKASNGTEAIALINELHPDLIFLDIHLPDMNGFELLNEVNVVPKIIFTTAYDQYAIKSFEYSAIDYLLKPIKNERLEKAINKIKIESDSTPVRSLEHSLFIKDSNNYHIANLRDIELFHTEGGYTKVFYKDKSPLFHKSLNQIEHKLDPQFFFRINRQQIVNITHVVEIEKWFKGKLKLVLKSGKEVEVSDRQSVKFKQKLSL